MSRLLPALNPPDGGHKVLVKRLHPSGKAPKARPVVKPPHSRSDWPVGRTRTWPCCHTEDE